MLKAPTQYKYISNVCYCVSIGTVASMMGACIKQNVKVVMSATNLKTQNGITLQSNSKPR